MSLNLGTLLAYLKVDGSNFQSGMAEAQSAATKLAASMALVSGAATTGFVAAISSGLQFASVVEQANIGFTTMLASGDKAANFINDMKDFASRTPFEFNDVLKAAQSLKAMGIQAEAVMPLLSSIGDAVAAMGGTHENVDSVTRALGQMNSKGMVASQEMMQLTEQGIPAWDMLAKHIGKSVPEAMKAVSDKTITAGTMINAFMEGSAASFGGAMDKQSQTLTGLWSTLMDTIHFALGDLTMPLMKALRNLMPALTQFVHTFLNVGTGPIGQALADVATALGLLLVIFDNLPEPMQQFIAAATMATVVVGTLAMAAGAAAIGGLLTLGSVISTMVAIGWLPLALAVGAVTTAFAMFISVAWPLTALVAAIVVGIGALYVAVTAAAEAFPTLWKAASDAAAGVLAYLTSMVDAVFSVAESVKDALSGGFQAAATVVDGVLTRMRDATITFAENVVSTLNGMVQGLGPLLEVLGHSDILGKSTTTTVKTIVSLEALKTGTVFSQMGNAATALGNAAIGLAGDLKDSVVTKAGDAWEAVKARLLSMLPEGMAEAVAKYLSGEQDMGEAAKKLTWTFDEGTAAAADAADGHKKLAEASAIASDALNTLGKGNIHALFSKLYSMSGASAKQQQKYSDSMGMSVQDTIDNLTALSESGAMSAEDLRVFQDMVDKAGTALEELPKDFDAFTQAIGNKILGAAGQIGELITAATEGAQTGGAWGALIAVIVELLINTTAFADKLSILDTGLTKLMDGLGQFIEGTNVLTEQISNIIGIFGDLLSPIMEHMGETVAAVAPVFQILGEIFEALEPMMTIVSTVMNTSLPILRASLIVLMWVLVVVGEIILAVAWALESAWNGIMEALAAVLDALTFTKAADDLRALEVDTDATYDSMTALGESAIALTESWNENSTAVDDATAATEAFTESLSNVPNGFKVAAARYTAMAAATGGVPAFGTGGIVQKPTFALVGEKGPEAIIPLDQFKRTESSGEGGGNVYISQIVVQANDPREFLDALDKEMKRSTFLKTGLPLARGPKFSTRRTS